jgi:hypothetical protein
MTGPHIRYTTPMGTVTVLRAETVKMARRLYGYAVKVATADLLIELMDGSEVLKSHQVAA